jgi:hypothetical protein
MVRGWAGHEGLERVENLSGTGVVAFCSIGLGEPRLAPGEFPAQDPKMG